MAQVVRMVFIGITTVVLVPTRYHHLLNIQVQIIIALFYELRFMILYHRTTFPNSVIVLYLLIFFLLNFIIFSQEYFLLPTVEVNER